MARLYLDENIGSRSLILAFVNAHHAITFCRDLGYSKVPDDFHLHIAAQRAETLLTHDSDFIGVHGALYRFARNHSIVDIHAGILLFPQDDLPIPEKARYVDAFFAASLPITNLLYIYQQPGSWVRYEVRDTYL